MLNGIYRVGLAQTGHMSINRGVRFLWWKFWSGRCLDLTEVRVPVWRRPGLPGFDQLCWTRDMDRIDGALRRLGLDPADGIVDQRVGTLRVGGPRG